MTSKRLLLLLAIVTCVLGEESITQHPSIVSMSPPSGTVDFEVGGRIVFTFDQPIVCSDECIAILVADNRATRVQLDDSMIEENKLTLIPQLQEGKTYTVSLPKESIVGANGASFDGLATYTITTSDFSEPVLVKTIPPMNGEVDLESTVELVFNKHVVVTGNWTATMTSGNETRAIEAYIVTAEGMRLCFPVAAGNYMSVTVEIAEGSIADLFGNEFSEAIVLTFHTKDTESPVVHMRLLPINDAMEASRISDVILTLSDDTEVSVNLGVDGGVLIRGEQSVFLYTPEMLELEQGEVTFANEAPFAPGETVTVVVPAGLFQDAYGNLNAITTFSFSVTLESVCPAVQAVQSVALFESGVLEVAFDNVVVAGSGNVTFERVRCCAEPVVSSAVETADAVLRVSYAGLEVNEEYRVTIGASTVRNIYGNGNAEAALTTVLRVHSSESPALAMERCEPREDSRSVALNSTAVLAFDQEVVMGECAVTATSGDEHYATHVVELEPLAEGFATTHSFRMEGLEPFTVYNLTIPAQCFFNAYGIAMEGASFSFLTTRGVAPTVLSFNQEGKTDVKFDAPLVFTFDQEVVVRRDAALLLRPRNKPSMARAIDAVSGSTVTLYNHEVAKRLEPATEYTVHVPSGVICNSDDLCMEETTFVAFTTEQRSTASVVLQSTVPAAGASQVDAAQEVVLRFTSNVRLCSGPSERVVIKENDEEVAGTVAVAGAEVRMRFALHSGFTYTYTYDETLVCTPKGAPVQYDVGSSFSFRVADTEGPLHYSMKVDGMQSVEVRFNENVVRGSGALRVLNSQGAVVVGPLYATLDRPSSLVVVFINAQNQPDDVYRFKFEEGFVTDTVGNLSPAFEEFFVFDRVAPFVEAAVSPASSIDPLELRFNEEVEMGACVLELEEDGRRTPYDMAAVQATAASLLVFPMSGVWPDSALLTLIIPAGCFRDLRGVPMAYTEQPFATPVVVPLRVLGAASAPALDSVQPVAAVVGEGVRVVFDAAVELVATKTVQLRSADGCVVSDGSHATVANATVLFPVLSYRCLTGSAGSANRVVLVAEEGAFVAPDTGASSPASTASAPLYAFSMMPAGPALLKATAVYAGGLQIAVGARIDLTFDRAVAAGASLDCVQFVDQHGASVPFAAQFHAEVQGAVLRLVVDEPFSTPSASQIRVVRVVPALPSEGIVAATDPQDACVGEATMARVFSLPPLNSRVEVASEGPVSTRAAFRIVFDQAVQPSNPTCGALVVHDSATTVSVPASRLVRESATTFRWTMSATELFAAHTEYTMVVDQSCFLLAETGAAATGVGMPLVFTTGADTVGPEPILLVNCTGEDSESEVSRSAALALGPTLTFCVLFNKPVAVRAGGFVSLRSQTDGSVVQVSSSKMSVNENMPMEIRVPCYDAHLVSSAVYTVQVDGIAEDALGNPMRNAETPFSVRTPARPPYRVTNVSARRLQTGAVLVEFDAAVDSGLEAEVSDADGCYYGIMAMPGYREVAVWQDVCVGVRRAQPVRIARVVTVDAFLDTYLAIVVSTRSLEDAGDEPALLLVPSDPAAVPQAPAAPLLLEVDPTEDVTHLALRASVPYGYASPVLGMTFLVEQGEEQRVVTLPVDDMGIYVAEVPRVTGTVEVRVKATTAAGASGFSEALVVPQVEVPSARPEKVAAESVTVEQLSSTAVRVAWAAPAMRESILGYLVEAEGVELEMVEKPEVVLRDLAAGEVRMNITVATTMGVSERLLVVFEFTPRITAELLGVTTGASDAMATFRVSYADAKVECALNAGHLIRAEAAVGASNEAALFFAQLLPGLRYAGSCWAYSTTGAEVSEAIAIEFTTALEAPLELEVLDFLPQTRAQLQVRVRVSRPAKVVCVAQEFQSVPAYNELLQYGVSALVLTAEETVIELKSARGPVEQPMAAFCAAFDTLDRPASGVVRSEERDVPTRMTVLPEPAAAVDGQTEVSVRPLLELAFDRPATCLAGSLVLESLRSGAKLAFDCGELKAEGSVLRLQITTALEHDAEYTWYFAADAQVEDEAGELVLAPMTPGAHRFTTSPNEVAPEVVLEAETLGEAPVGDVVVVTFSEVVQRGAGEVLVRHGAFTHAAQAVVADTYLLLNTVALHARTAYELVLDECAVVDLAGNCLPRKVLRFATLEDAFRPYVTASEPQSGAEAVPNDVPLVLTFSEEVVLADASELVVRLNRQAVPLAPLAVRVKEGRVEIDLEGGYSQGNEALERVEVEVEVKEGAFTDREGNKNEYFSMQFTATPARCGSSYLASYMKDDCQCYSRKGRCVCDCGVNLFEL